MAREIHIPREWSEIVWDIMERHNRLSIEFPEAFMEVCAEVQGFYAIAHMVAFTSELRNIIGEAGHDV